MRGLLCPSLPPSAAGRPVWPELAVASDWLLPGQLRAVLRQKLHKQHTQRRRRHNILLLPTSSACRLGSGFLLTPYSKPTSPLSGLPALVFDLPTAGAFFPPSSDLDLGVAWFCPTSHACRPIRARLPRSRRRLATIRGTNRQEERERERVRIPAHFALRSREIDRPRCLGTKLSADEAAQSAVAPALSFRSSSTISRPPN